MLSFLTIGGPCKVIGPVFEELSNTNTNLKFVKVDVDELEDVSSEAGVR
jgi:thioredoxin 1